MAGLNRMMRGRVLAERTGAVRGGKRRGSRKAPRLFGGGKHRDCSRWEAAGPAESTGAVRGDTSAAFAVMPGAIGHMYSVQA